MRKPLVTPRARRSPSGQHTDSVPETANGGPDSDIRHTEPVREMIHMPITLSYRESGPVFERNRIHFR